MQAHRGVAGPRWACIFTLYGQTRSTDSSMGLHLHAIWRSRWSSIIACAEQVEMRCPVDVSNSQQQLPAIALFNSTASSRVPCQIGCVFTRQPYARLAERSLARTTDHLICDRTQCHGATA